MADYRHLVTDWKAQIAMGRVPGIKSFHKFGTNPDVGTSEETVWTQGGDYTWLTTGTSLEIVCTDNVNGVGQVIKVVGLDENWEWQEAEVTLNGQTPAAISGSWTVVHRATQISAAPDPVGDVYIATTAATYASGVPNEANLVQAKVDYTDASQSTGNAFVVIPAGHIGVLLDFGVSMLASSGSTRHVEAFLEAAELADGSTTTWAPRVRTDELEVSTNAPHDDINFAIPQVFPAQTRLEARAKASAAAEVRVDFNVIFVPVN